jgi:hypothetical protein
MSIKYTQLLRRVEIEGKMCFLNIFVILYLKLSVNISFVWFPSGALKLRMFEDVYLLTEYLSEL